MPRLAPHRERQKLAGAALHAQDIYEQTTDWVIARNGQIEHRLDVLCPPDDVVVELGIPLVVEDHAEGDDEAQARKADLRPTTHVFRREQPDGNPEIVGTIARSLNRTSVSSWKPPTTWIAYSHRFFIVTSRGSLFDSSARFAGPP